MKRIRTGDEVVVIAGRSSGQRGHVLKVLDEARVVVENVNMVKRHTKPNPPHHQGGIIEKEAPIHSSNLMLFNPMTKRGDRVGFRTLEDGKKVRFFRSTGEVVDG